MVSEINSLTIGITRYRSFRRSDSQTLRKNSSVVTESRSMPEELLVLKLLGIIIFVLRVSLNLKDIFDSIFTTVTSVLDIFFNDLVVWI